MQPPPPLAGYRVSAPGAILPMSNSGFPVGHDSGSPLQTRRGACFDSAIIQVSGTSQTQGWKLGEPSMNQFTVGDMAVYQAQGVGEITDISNMEVGGGSIEVYTLRILEKGTTIRIPVAKATQVGLRELINTQQVDEIYEILREEGHKPTDKTWNRRYRAYQDRLKSGSVHEIARVLRDLYRLQSDKDLSFGERKMFNQARSLLVTEISMATRREEVDVARELEGLFAGEC